MALVLKFLYDGYNEYLISKDGNPELDYPFMRTPVPALLLIGSYLYFVKSLGPKWMAKRKAFEIENIMIIYNSIQIIANLVLGLTSFYHSYYQPHYKFICQEVAKPGTDLAALEMKFTFYYFVLKVVDLLDTVFFVLRKKNNQISFLHLYHHAGMVAMTWGGVKWSPGGHAALLGILNAFVHVIMYTYYLLTIFSSKVKNSLWWKKYVTQIQLIQFGIFAFHFGHPLIYPTCGYPRPFLFILFVQNIFIFLLFGDFYWRAYIKKKIIAPDSSTKVVMKERNKIT